MLIAKAIVSARYICCDFSSRAITSRNLCSKTCLVKGFCNDDGTRFARGLFLWLRRGRQQVVQTEVHCECGIVIDQVVGNLQGRRNARHLPSAEPWNLLSQRCVSQF